MINEKISKWLYQLPIPVAERICFELISFASLYNLLSFEHDTTIGEKINMVHDLLNDNKLSLKDNLSRALVFYAGIDIVITSEENSFIENIDRYTIPLPLQQALPEIEKHKQEMSALKSGWEFTFESWKSFKKGEMSTSILLNSIDL